MEITPCKHCLYYMECILESENPNDPPTLKERLYKIFVEGWDCFVGHLRFVEETSE